MQASSSSHTARLQLADPYLMKCPWGVNHHFLNLKDIITNCNQEKTEYNRLAFDCKLELSYLHALMQILILGSNVDLQNHTINSLHGILITILLVLEKGERG